MLTNSDSEKTVVMSLKQFQFNIRDNHQYGESVTQELEGTQAIDPRYPQRGYVVS